MITSNSTKSFDKLPEVEKDALKERIVFCEINILSKQKGDKFPFNTRQLAHFMVQLYQQIKRDKGDYYPTDDENNMRDDADDVVMTN